MKSLSALVTYVLIGSLSSSPITLSSAAFTLRPIAGPELSQTTTGLEESLRVGAEEIPQEVRDSVINARWHERYGQKWDAEDAWNFAIHRMRSSPGPYLAHLFYERALLRIIQRSYQAAYADLCEAIRINGPEDKSSVGLYVKQAEVLALLKRFVESESDWTKVIEWYSMDNLYNVGAYVRLAQVQMRMGKYDLAEANLKKAAELDPNSIGSRLTLAQLYEDTQRPELARPQREEVARLKAKELVQPQHRSRSPRSDRAGLEEQSAGVLKLGEISKTPQYREFKLLVMALVLSKGKKGYKELMDRIGASPGALTAKPNAKLLEEILGHLGLPPPDQDGIEALLKEVNAQAENLVVGEAIDKSPVAQILHRMGSKTNSNQFKLHAYIASCK